MTRAAAPWAIVENGGGARSRRHGAPCTQENACEDVTRQRGLEVLRTVRWRGWLHPLSAACRKGGRWLLRGIVSWTQPSSVSSPRLTAQWVMLIASAGQAVRASAPRPAHMTHSRVSPWPLQHRPPAPHSARRLASSPAALQTLFLVPRKHAQRRNTINHGHPRPACAVAMLSTQPKQSTQGDKLHPSSPLLIPIRHPPITCPPRAQQCLLSIIGKFQ